MIAREETIAAISSMMSIVGLSNTNIGQSITQPLIESGEILRISNEIVQPYYREKSQRTLGFVADAFNDGLPYRVHRSEGAFFLWMWFPEMPISSRELYERLKQRDVLVISGDYFFYGLDEDWDHRNECIRVSFTMDDNVVRDGLQVIADEVGQL